jgi:hypothetical protein
VTFTPTASGSRSASLSITDNVSGSPQAVSLRGNAPGGLTWSSDSESSSAGWGSRGRPN